MKRRDFIALTIAWPLAARAQQAGRLRTVGFLAGSAGAYAQWIAAFKQRMSELGWSEGRNVSVLYRWTEGVGARADDIAAEFAGLKVDAIVTSGAANVIAAKRAAPTTPIVFAGTADPVAIGLVASLARPGGNVTGLSVESADLAGKEVELLREIVPDLHRLAILVDAGSPGAMLEMSKVQQAARELNLDVMPLEIRQLDDIEAVIAGLKGTADAVYCVPDPLLSTGRARLVAAMSGVAVPAIYGSREYVALGGLISYGPNIADLFRRAADFVDKILHGIKPADIPVEEPTKFYLVINLKTAKALGLKIPQSIQVSADEMIE